jgi:histone acetyltransferase 1
MTYSRPLDYDTDEEAFIARVEEDAVSFRPMGTLIHSYTRPVPNTSEVVEYEVYHVIVISTFYS